MEPHAGAGNPAQHRSAGRLDRHRRPQHRGHEHAEPEPGFQLRVVRQIGAGAAAGHYAGTVRRALDQTIYGDMRIYSKMGWSNYNGVQLEPERHYSKGLSYQFFYLLSNSSSTGATPSQGGDFTPEPDRPADRLPGTYPKSVEDRVRFLRYIRDGAFRNTASASTTSTTSRSARARVLRQRRQRAEPPRRRLADRRIWRFESRWFSLPAGRGPVNPLQIYGKQRSTTAAGHLLPGVPRRQRLHCGPINTAKGVSGMPSNYLPSSYPVNPTPANGGDPNYKYYETNNVYVPLNTARSSSWPWTPA